MKKRIIPILIAAVIFCLALTACSGEKATDGNAPDEAVTSGTVSSEYGIFGAFESRDMEGKEVDFTILQGKKLTMVNAWATFCGPCISEMPDLEKISKEYADKGFQIVGFPIDVMINADGTYANDGTFEDAQAVIKKTGVTYTNILLSDSLVDSELGQVYTIPTTYFLDENGNQIGEAYIGSMSYDDWCSIIDGLLSEMN